MNIGDKVTITQHGMTKRQAQVRGVLKSAHYLTRKYWEENLTFEAGMQGIIEDINASGTKWKIRVGSNLYYVPCESVELIPKV